MKRRKMKGKSIEIEKGLTARVIAFIVIFYVIMGIITVTWTYLIPGYLKGMPMMFLWGLAGNQVMRWATQYLQWSWIPFFWLFIMGLVSALLRRRGFTVQEMTVIWAALAVGVWNVAFQGLWKNAILRSLLWAVGPLTARQGILEAPFTDWILKNAASPLGAIWGPLDEVSVATIRGGGQPVPWGAWMPFLAFWTVSLIFLMVIFPLCLGVLLKRLYVDIEALPFPIAVGATEIIKNSSTNGEDALRRFFGRRWFWIGLILGLVVHIYHAIEALTRVPRFHTIHGYMVGFGTYALLSWAPLAFVFEPWMIGLGMYLPIDVLLTSFVSYIIFWLVLGPAFTAIGLFTPMSSMPDQWIMTNLHWGNVNPPGGIFEGGGYSTIMVGIILGMAIWPLITHRDYVADVIKSLWEKPSWDTGDPISTRTALIGTIIGWIGWVGLWIAAGAHAGMALIFAIFMAFYYIGITRWRAESAGYGTGDFTKLGTAEGSIRHLIPSNIYYAFGAPYGYPTPSDASAPALFHFYTYARFFDTEPPGLYGGLLSVEAFRIASLTKTRLRDCLIGMILALVIPIFILLPTALWAIYQWEGAPAGVGGYITARMMYQEWKWPGRVWPPSPNFIYLLLFGFLLTVILYAIRARSPRIFLTPAGIALSLMMGPFTWLPFLIALITKWLMIRVGGAAYFEEKGVPLATGLVVSIGIVVVIVCVGAAALLSIG